MQMQFLPPSSAYPNPAVRDYYNERNNEARSIKVPHIDIPTEGREEFLKRFVPDSVRDFVQSLRVHNPDEFNQILSSWVNIHKVSIELYVSKDELIELLPHLKYVQLTEASLDVLTQISKSENIEVVQFHSVNKLEGKALEHFASLKNLRSFNARFKYVDSDAIEAFGKNVSGLEKLDVFFNEERRTYLNLDGFGKLTNLTSLALRGLERITNAQLTFLQNLPNLKELSLEGCNDITCACASNLKNLKYLSIERCAPIKEGSLDPLADTCIETLVLKDSQEYCPTYIVNVRGLFQTKDRIGTANLNTLLALKNVTTLKSLVLKDCHTLYANDEKRKLQDALLRVVIQF